MCFHPSLPPPLTIENKNHYHFTPSPTISERQGRSLQPPPGRLAGGREALRRREGRFPTIIDHQYSAPGIVDAIRVGRVRPPSLADSGCAVKAVTMPVDLRTIIFLRTHAATCNSGENRVPDSHRQGHHRSPAPRRPSALPGNHRAAARTQSAIAGDPSADPRALYRTRPCWKVRRCVRGVFLLSQLDGLTTRNRRAPDMTLITVKAYARLFLRAWPRPDDAVYEGRHAT